MFITLLVLVLIFGVWRYLLAPPFTVPNQG